MFFFSQLEKNPKPLRDNNSIRLVEEYHTIVVFATPKEMVDLDIGYTLDQFPYDDEMDQYFPFDLGTLCQEIRCTTIGINSGEPIAYPIPNSYCEVNLVININGRYYKLNEGEWDVKNFTFAMTPTVQLRVFQRLLNQKQITMDDLAAADIDTNIYKQLMLNEKMSELMYRKKMATVLVWLERQRDNPVLRSKVEYYMENC